MAAGGLEPGAMASARSSNRNECSVSSLITPKSTQVARALSAEDLSTDPTRRMRASNVQTPVANEMK